MLFSFCYMLNQENEVVATMMALNLIRYENGQDWDLGYSIHTDIKIRRLVRKIQLEKLKQSCQGLVRRIVANLVKPWHIAVWLLCFVPLFAIIEAKTPWRGVAAQAEILAFVITSIAAWASGKKKGTRGEDVGVPKKKKTKFQKTTFKQKMISVLVILIPSLIVIFWLVFTVLHNPVPK